MKLSKPPKDEDFRMPPARKREPIVPQRVRDAVDHMYATPGATLQSTAQHIGLTTRKLRYYLGLPHVLRWLLQDKQARLEVASAGNLPALLSVRDHGDNAMARVHASKTIETMLDNTSERTGIGRQVQETRRPGLQIVIVERAAAAAPLIEATPVPSNLKDGTQEARSVQFALADPRGAPRRD
jgi:hypothetical protein